MDEDIVVADTNNHRIQIFEKTGDFKYQFGQPGQYTHHSIQFISCNISLFLMLIVPCSESVKSETFCTVMAVDVKYNLPYQLIITNTCGQHHNHHSGATWFLHFHLEHAVRQTSSPVALGLQS